MILSVVILENNISFLEVNIHAPSCVGNEVNGIAIHYTTTCQVHCIICYHQTHCSEVADPLQRCANLKIRTTQLTAKCTAESIKEC